MAEGRIKRRIVWEQSGVSEIIGTILMLSITVVLFSSVITFVGTMPTPERSTVLEMKSSIQLVDNITQDWEKGVILKVRHHGGPELKDMDYFVIPLVNGEVLVNSTLNSSFRRISPHLKDLNNNGKWNVGEYWEYTIKQTEAPSLKNNSRIGVKIFDFQKDAVIWEEELGLVTHPYAPIIRNAWIDSDIATMVDDPGPITFTAPFAVYVEVLDPQNNLNNNSIFVNMESMYKNGSKPLQLLDVYTYKGVTYGHHNDNIFLGIFQQPNRTNVGYHQFTFNASSKSIDPFTGKPLPSQAVFTFPVGVVVGDNPQIVVRSEYIRFSDPEPTNGDLITITATIQNLGGAGSRVNVSFYNNEMIPSAMIGNLTISVPQVGERDARMEWRASPGGMHTIIVSAWPIDGEEFPETRWDNVNSTDIIVMPKILLVDDDGYLNDLSARDTVSPMRASLEAADFAYEFITVGAGDGPGYNYGEEINQLKNYDIVIWMTGYKEAGTLTLKDTENLEMFLRGDETGGQGGSLWLISQGFWSEARNPLGAGPQLNTFAQNYLKVPDPQGMFPGDLAGIIFGNETHPVTDYFAENPMDTEVTVPGTGTVHHWQYNNVPDKESVALTDSILTPTTVFALSYDSDMDANTSVRDSRRLSQTWDFSRIPDTATQAQYTYKAIMWLGNITMKFTEDLAISGQSISPEVVFFKQPVTISFTVRNNGFVEYPPNTVQYLLRIFDMSGNDVVIPEDKYIPDRLGTGSNNTVLINYTWTPERLGYHRIWIMVDPYYQISESNKLNNMISNYWGRGELNVQYRVLLVDDDGSVNNGGLGTDEASHMAAALDYLGYTYEYYVVNASQDGPAFEAGTNGAGLSEYNAVIWVSGADTAMPLRPNDVLNITSYMEIGGYFWLMGTGMWTDNTVTDFQRNYLKINSVTAQAGMGSALLGVTNDIISHGMDFPVSADPSADVLVPVTDADPLTTDAIGFTGRSSTQFNSVRYHGKPYSGIDLTYRTATTAWSLSSLNNSYHRAEFVFMMLRWFDKPEDRIEARITNTDIWISDDHPQIGSGYVIRAVIHNTGGATANVLVRFMDGNTQIGSTSISVSPGGKTTAEMIWVPLFAGHRTMGVFVDPIAEVPEIFEWSNNNATRSVYVYFFWDDMQSGAGKWTHASTILRISGEGALEYFHGTRLDTSIVDNFNMTQSTYLNINKDPGFYHSYDSAFWLQETPGGANGTGGTRGTPLPVQIKGVPVTQTRYMRNNQSTINNLFVYHLGLTQSAIGREIFTGNNQNLYAGIRVWKRSSAPSYAETEITSGAAVAIAYSTSTGTWSNIWTPPATALNITDSIVVRVYVATTNPPATLRAEFITENLGATSLDGNAWTVSYYLMKAGGGSSGFSYGEPTTWNSRIEGFTFTTLDLVPPTVVSTTPVDGAPSVPTNQNVVVVFSEPMNTDATNRPTLTQTSGTDPGGWSFNTWLTNTTAVWTHANWNIDDDIELRLSGAQDRSSNVMTPYTWSFHTASGATATATGPVGTSNVATITLTYSWVGSPDHVSLYYSKEYNASLGGQINWTHIGNETVLDGSFLFTLTESGEYWWIAIAVGGGSAQVVPVNGTFPDTVSPYIYDNVRPTVIATLPQGSDVTVDAYIVIVFTKFINPTTVILSISPNPGGLIYIWNADNTKLTISHFNFMTETLHSVTITNARDLANNQLDPVPWSWTFVTGESSAGGMMDWYGKSPEGPNYNKTAVTESVSLNNLEAAKLSFWHKYNLLPGVNGGFLQVGYKVAGVWNWKYVIPSNAYTGNLKEQITDSLGNPVRWCWNGISARGTFGWEYVELNLLAHVPVAYRDDVRVMFNYTQWGNGTGYGWYIDDVNIMVSRSNMVNPVAGDRDLWELVTTTDRNGVNTTAWQNVDPADSRMVAAGLDNFLMTHPIDLTNARSAYLSAFVKFNFNYTSGAPPDGFRIEVSKDNGVTWEPINLGVRSAWNISGTGFDGDDDAIDGKAYAGINSGNYWVSVGSLTRVNTDLSSFSGNVIQIRFRMVTNNHPAYGHNNNFTQFDPGFGGFLVDDVMVMGETIMG